MTMSGVPRSGPRGTLRLEDRVHDADGIITITNANTTIAYCRYDCSGEIEYLFVSAPFRRQGYAGRMLDLVEERLGTRLRFNPPISPLGRHVIDAYSRRCSSAGKSEKEVTSRLVTRDERAAGCRT